MAAIAGKIIERFQAYFSEALKYFQLYFADSFYPLLFLLSLILIFSHPAAKKERDSLVWSNLLFIALAFCPVSIYLIMKMVGVLVYWRVFWMLTISIVIPYAVTQAVYELSKPMLRLLTVVVASAAIIFSGELILSEEYFTERENSYKLPSEVIEVSDIISEHADEQEIAEPKAAVPEYLSVYIRQYDAGIRLAYGRSMLQMEWSQTDLFKQINSESPTPKKLVNQFRKEQCHYLVLLSSLSLDEELSAYSFVKIGETENYTIFFDEESVNEESVSG